MITISCDNGTVEVSGWEYDSGIALVEQALRSLVRHTQEQKYSREVYEGN
jgi:hypothetical protein